MTASLLQVPTLVVEQRRKLFELNDQYRIFDTGGTQIGVVEQVGQSFLTLLARIGTDLDVALPVTLQVLDAAGSPGPVDTQTLFSMRLSVSRPDGAVGSIHKRIRMGKARFSLLDAAGSQIGEVRAENWRAKDFAVYDGSSNEVARVTKKWRGLATELFTDADTYVVDLTPAAIDPLRTLALAASLAIDVVLKQKDY
jgi:Scramblase.